MTIEPAGDRSLDFTAAASAVRSAGFKPAGMWLLGTGALERQDGRLHVRLRGWTKTFDAHGAPGIQDGAEHRFHARVDYAAEPLVLVLGEHPPQRD